MKYKKITVLIILVMLLFVCSLSTISAANQTITPGDTGGIREAITNTSVNPGDTIYLQPGTYNKTGNDTNFTISKNITLQGNGSTDSIIIDAQELSRIFIMDHSLNVTFINITFINGYVNASPYFGGAAYNGYGNTTMTFINCSFINNTVIHTTGTDGNGAISNAGKLLIINSTFTSNNANFGSAIYNSGVSANCTVINSTFTNNNNIANGIIYNSLGASCAVINSIFTNNNASSGGAIGNNGGNCTVINSTFIDNNAISSSGAIFNSGVSANCTVINSTFINNGAGTNGGAIGNNGGNCTVINSTFNGNTASSGNGGAITSNAGGTLNVTDSTFDGNTASGNGGGINNAGNLTVSGNSMLGNTAGALGDVIYNSGAIGVLNLIYLGNSTVKVRNNTQVIIYATLTDDMGNSVTGGNISFYVNGTLIGTITSIEGKANMGYTMTNIGIVPVAGDYSNNGQYLINVKPGKLETVLKFDANSTITVPNNVKVGKTINITGVATDEFGNPLSDIKINITVDGKTYTVTTDINGRWTLPYKPTHTGNVVASVTWAGNATYFGFTNSTNFNVKKGNIIVTITVTENDDGSITITANATDEDGDPVKNHPVDFFLDDELVGSGITDKNGISSITIPANKISDGPHTITVIVTGGDNFNDGIASIEFTKTPENNDTNNTTNKTSKNPTTAAAMKNTGIPIITALLVLLANIGLVIRKRE